MERDGLLFDLGNGYHVKSISFQDYLDACAQLEDQIFGEYFEFKVQEALSDSERQNLETWNQNHLVSYRICLGIYTSTHELVGWQYSIQEHGGEVLMKDTGILPAHQRKGIYKGLLPILLEMFRKDGFTTAVSYHRMTNNAVIIPKLRAGFLINGVTADRYGMAVQLVYPFNELHRASLLVRSGERRPRGVLAGLMGL